MTPKPKKKPAKVFIMPPPLTHPCGSITIALPYPPQCLTPNAQRGQSRWAAIAKSRVVKAHRELAKRAMADAMQGRAYCGEFGGYSLAHFFPTTAFRDDDNADAACKSYRDGICDFLTINDKLLKKCRLSSQAKDASCPRVEVTLWTSEHIKKYETGINIAILYR
jgi:hypothetical protein